MNDVPVYFSLNDENRFWSGMPRERALEWTRVLLHRRPSVPGTVIHRAAPDLKKGIPAGFTDWAQRARVAESLGFTPATYEALHAALDEIEPARFAAHPDNHRVKVGLTAERPFDVGLWSRWPALVSAGTSPLEAATRVLAEAS